MELIVIGLNHKTAPIEVRERLAIQQDRMAEALCGAKSIPSLKEGMILSTCNRVEIYAASRMTEKTILDLKDFLSRFHGLPMKDFEKLLYLFTGEDAVRHIFRVASSLDSMVVGEPQILGQIKSAYNAAAESKASGLIFHRLLHRAFHVAKRVRTETKIGNNAVSISFVAVELAKKIFETLSRQTVLLIGAGEMCELAARHLVSGGVEKVLVTNRTFERAQGLAEEFRGEPVPFGAMPEALKRADIVISATNSPQHLIGHEQVLRVMKGRKQKPIFFIDIADPRDIDPRVGEIENVYLFNIDDLQNVANENIKDRQLEAKKAEAIVQEEVARFIQWYQSLEVTPTIAALRTKFEEIRRKELEKTLSLHPNLSEREKRSLEALTSSIVNKILHAPLTHLKRMDEEVATDLFVDTLRTLFGLEDNGPNPSAETARGVEERRDIDA
jgi:glutamyl-tRNA reductase